LEDEGLYGAVGNFPDEGALVDAIGKIRERGYSRLEAYTPFPIHGIDEALGNKPSKLGWFVVCCGLTGTTIAATFIWWSSAIDYRLTIGGKPPFDFTFSIPIMFEVTILLSAFASVYGMFLLFNNLPKLYHSIFNYRKAEVINDDGFVLAIEADDPKFDANQCVEVLESLGASDVEVVAK
jgi:hypothetical protein